MITRIIYFLVILLIFSPAFAGTTGKIAGVITDKNSGMPIPGVNVLIEGLSIGAATDLNGEYFIINVPVGSHKITVSYIGYKTIEFEGAKVQPDRTLQVNFELEETVMEIGDAIVIEAERERIQKDLTMSSQYVDGDEIKILPVDNYEQAAQLQAGAVGSNFRGGRASETLPLIDGLNVKDPTAGYDAIKDEEYIQSNLILPELAIEQMEIITGGFNAEYGNMQSAVINIITKEGGQKHTGRITFNTAIFNHVETRYWYKNPSGEFEFYRDNMLQDFFDKTNDALTDSLKAVGVRAPYINKALSDHDLHSYDLDNYKRNEYEFSLLGPVPFASNKIRYSLHGEIVDNDRLRESFKGPYFQTALHLNLSYRLSPRDKIQLMGIGSLVKSRGIAHREAKYPGGYYPGYGLIPPKVDTEEYVTNLNYLADIKWVHSISNHTFYEVRLGYKYKSFQSRMKDWNDRDGDGDYNEFLEWKKMKVPDSHHLPDPDPEWKTDWCYVTDDMKWLWVPADPSIIMYDTTAWQGGWKLGVPGKSGWKEVWWFNTSTYEYNQEWRFLTGTHNEMELKHYPVAEINESTLYTTIRDGYFDSYGDGNNYFDSKNTGLVFKFDINSQINSRHLLKAGVNLKYTNIDMLNIIFFSAGNIYFDIYDITPMDLSCYIQDKMEFEGMIINAGLRADYFDPGKNVIYPGNFADPIDDSKYPGEDGYITNPKIAKPFFSINPRIGVSHPITENSVLHFSYGHFYQRPDYRYWYENLNYSFEGAYMFMGNPSMVPEKTVSYEIGLQQNIGDYLIGVNLFFKDIVNLVDQVQAGNWIHSYYLYTNRDWGNVRGCELILRKFFSNYFSGNLNYTYMIAKGSSSSPRQGGSEIYRKRASAQKAYYLNWDRRHTVNANITFRVPPKWGPTLIGHHVLGNWHLNVLFTYGKM